MRHRAIDLFQKVGQGGFRRQRTERRFLIHWVTGLQCRQRLLEFFQEFIGQFIDHDEPFRGAAGLPGIIHASQTAHLTVCQIGVFKDDERIAAASSMDEGLRFVPARAAMLRPAATLPVSATPLMRGRRRRGRIARVRSASWYTAVGRAASARAFERDRALRHDARVLHHTTLPAIKCGRRFSPAGNRENSGSTQKITPIGLLSIWPSPIDGRSFTGARKRSRCWRNRRGCLN